MDNCYTFIYYKTYYDEVTCYGLEVTCYGLDVSGIESQWGVRFSTPVHAGPGAHPASYTWVPGLSQG
jgi:hypothetical protein